MDEAAVFRTVFGAVGGTLALLGLVILAFGVRARRAHRRFETRGARADGVVTDYRLVDPSEDMYSPLIRFTTAAGRQIEFQSSITTSGRGPVGRRVRVAYSEGLPERAEIVGQGSWPLGLAVGPLLILGGLFMAWVGQLAE